MNEHIADQRHLMLVAKVKKLEEWQHEAVLLLERLTYRLIDLEAIVDSHQE